MEDWKFDEERTYFSAMVKIHSEFPKQLSDIDGTHDGTHEKTRAEQIIEAIKADNTITRERIGRKLGVSPRTVSRELDKMKDKVRFIGSGDNGHWEIIC